MDGVFVFDVVVVLDFVLDVLLTLGIDLGDFVVFGLRGLGTLTAIERDRLSFAQIVEGRLGARRLVEEVLVAVARRNEPETLVADEPLDRAIHRCHVCLLVVTTASNLPALF
jgi:hypothetical protein